MAWIAIPLPRYTKAVSDLPLIRQRRVQEAVARLEENAYLGLELRIDDLRMMRVDGLVLYYQMWEECLFLPLLNVMRDFSPLGSY